jgi:hypothetical protein
MMTEQGRIAAARRDVQQSAAKWDAKLGARMSELAAQHGVPVPFDPKDRERMLRIARNDEVFLELLSHAWVAERVPEVLLAAGYVPIVGDPGEPIRWKHSRNIEQH